MNNTFKTRHTVNYSEADVNCRLRIDNILSRLQEITAFHSKELGVDGGTTLKKCNAIWVLGKMKIEILRLPEIYDELELETWPTSVSAIRFMRDYKIAMGGKEVILGRSEWCTLDAESMAVRRTNTICYPFELEHRKDLSGCADFSKIKETLSENEFNHKHQVRAVDIDFNKHTNNLAYVRMALNCFTPEEYAKLKVKEFEMYYVSQSYYNEEISVYKRKTDYGYFIEGKIREKVIFDCVIKFE